MTALRWADLAVGKRAEFSVRVTGRAVEQFRELSNDTNPVHSDGNVARGRGFSDRVVYGMLLASYYSRLVGVYLPGDFSLLNGISVEFRQPVYIGDELTVSGEITYLNDAYKRAEIRGEIRRAGELVCNAKIRVGVHE